MIESGPARGSVAPRSTLPDLIFRVRYELRDGRHQLGYTLVFRVAPPEGSLEEFGPVVLDREPGAFFQSLFDDIRHLAREAQAPEDLSRRLAGRGVRLLEELLPEPLQRRFEQLRNRVRTVQVLSDEPWIPWELLRFREREGEPGCFFGEAFALTRWLRGVPDAPRLPLRRMALVVPRDSNLPHAEPERRYLLDQGIDGRRIEEIPARPSAVAEALARDGYDGWHFTGHASTPANEPQRSWMGLEDNTELRPDDFYDRANLWSSRPLIFMNACQTARAGFSLSGLGGWAHDFFHVGAGAFLGTYWAVRDEPALCFSQAFYGALFAGAAAGEAVRTARLEVRDRFPGDPSWLAYTLFANPLAACPASAEIERWMPFVREAPPDIRRKVRSFSRLLTEDADGFVGREWVFSEIDRFLAETPRGVFLLQGEPGIGKSSVMAELVRRHGWVHHFNIRAEGLQSAADFLSNVCAQLIAAHRLDWASLPPEATANGHFLADLLDQVSARLAPGERSTVVVDALDEAIRDPSAPDANLLFLPRRLPPGIHLILSSRPGGAPLLLDFEPRTFEISQNDRDHLDDIRELVRHRLSPGLLSWAGEQGLKAPDFVEEMVGRSQGNFMYLRHVLPEIEAGTYQDLRFQQLPKGLARYYEDHWRRIRSRDEEAWFAWKLPVLEALTVIQEALPLRRIARFAGVEDTRRVQAALDQWREFLYQTETEDPETGERQKCFRFYHASFQEFIAAKDEVKEERVRLKDRRGRIAELLWGDLFGPEEGEEAERPPNGASAGNEARRDRQRPRSSGRPGRRRNGESRNLP